MEHFQTYRKQFVYILAFFIIYCLFLSWSFLFQNVDDAYISFRYGRNLMEGNGLVFNPGEYVEGYTNFLWTVITAPFTVITFADVSVFAIILCLLLSILNIAFLSKIGHLFNSDFVPYKSIIIVAPSLFLALDNSFAFWAIGGMEVPLFIFFILTAVYSYFRINDGEKYFYLMIAGIILTTLTRPEGNMIFVIFFLHMILFRRRIALFKKYITKLLVFYFLFCLVYYGFKYFYYGQVIPNTFYAKGVTDLRMNFVLGTKYLALCTGTRLYILIFIAFIPVKEALKKFRESFLILMCGVYIVYLVFVGGDWMYANRFFVPIIPLLYILSIVGFINLLIKLQKLFNDVNKTRRFAYFLVALISIVLFTTTILLLEYRQLVIEEDNAKYEMQWSMFGRWLKMNVPPDTRIAVGPAGKIPYYSELYTIDMWGLNNSHIANTESKRLQAGHKKFDFEYVLSLNPEFIIGRAGFMESEMPDRYERFNAPEEKYKCFDVVFRLKEEYRGKK